jgi:hypothetical protein
MTERIQNPDLRGILNETFQALERFEADRLQEIALTCEELMGERRSHNRTRRNQISIDDRRGGHEMGLFKRLLEQTHANLTFLYGLSTMRGARLEYGRVPAKMCSTAEAEYGNH